MLILMTAILLMAFIQPIFSGYDFMNVEDINDFAKRYNRPSLRTLVWHRCQWDVLFDAVWAGAKTSISISVIAVNYDECRCGCWCYLGCFEKFDKIMLEIYNVVTNVPQLLIVIVLSYTFGSGFWNLIFAMCITGWLSTAYFIRVQVMIMRDV